jgi:hypothetical protein
MTTKAFRLELEIERDRDPIVGRLSDEHGHTVRFTGWLELISAMQKAVINGGTQAQKDEQATSRGSRNAQST